MQRICLSLVLGLVLVGTADAQKGGGKVKYTVDVLVNGAGVVTSSTGGISCPGACTTSVNSGTSITFTATSDQGATFTGWGGDCAGTSTTCSLTISAPTSVSAAFEGGGGGGGGSAPTISQVTFDLDAGTVTAVGSGMADVTEVTWGNELAPLIIDGTPTETGVSARLPTSLFYGDFLLTVTNPAGSAKWQLTFPEAGPPGPKGDPGADGADGADGANCSVTQQTGGALIACDDGSTAALADGQDGSNGTDGASCSVTQLDGGAVISCDGGTTATLADGQDGGQGPEGPRGLPGPDVRIYDSRDNLGIGGLTGVLSSLTTGSSNVAFGSGVAYGLTTGSDNLAMGRVALIETTTGSGNIALGTAALQYNVIGSENLGIGPGSLYFSNGDRNIAIGRGAGAGLRVGSDNIAIGNEFYEGDASNTIRIGAAQNRTFIAGIRGVTPEGSLQQVIIDESGQLGSRDFDISQLIIDGADNTGAGRGALGPFNTGRFNTFLGTFALGANTTGEENTSIGWVSLEQNTSGYRNTAIGGGAMRLNLTGRDNLAIGVDALYTAEDTCCNAAIGPWALKNLQYGYGNTALGHYAGSDLISGIGNLYLQHPGVAEEDNTIRIGQGQNRAFVAGVRDVTIGGDVMQVVINGEGQLGSSPIASISDAWDSQGSFWLYPNGGSNNNSSGANNVALGSLGMLDNTTGAGNVSIGHYAMQYNTSGSNNVALGNGALYFSPGNSNTAIGIRAGTFLQEGSGNTYIASEGANSESNTLRIGSVYGFDQIPRTSRAFIAGIRGVTPEGSLQQVVINENGQLGSNPAISFFSDNLANVYLGGMNSKTQTGIRNTALGSDALNVISTGSGNVAIGALAMNESKTASNNIAIGEATMQYHDQGYENVAVGRTALMFGAGNQNIALGTGAGVGLRSGSNNIAIGNGFSEGDQSNTIRIGESQSRAFIAGVYGTSLGEASSQVVIDAYGQLGTVSSSARFKTDIVDMGPASEKLLSLRPVTFRYLQQKTASDGAVQYGLIAEEVAQILPELVVYGEDGKPDSVAYHTLISMLLNELQKQNARLRTLETELAALRTADEQPTQLLAYREASVGDQAVTAPNTR